MKKTSKIIALLFSMLLCFFSAFVLGCGNQSPEAKTVSGALNGAYSVFQDSKGYMANTEEDDAKIKLIKSYLVKDKTSSSVGYDFSSAPLTQFYYLKRVYDKIGNGFEFGKTYADTISSTVGYDFYNLTKSDSPEHSVPYQAVAMVNIDVTAENTVTAEVGFAFYYNKDTMNERRQYLYTEFTIKVDPDNNKTFTFTAYTVNNSSEVDEDGKYVTYAYDYYKVSDGKTLTKRHFYVTSPSIIVINETIGPTYYLEDDDFYFVAGAEVYENGFISRSYNTDPRTETEIGYTQIKNALFNSICMDYKCNSATISYSTLFTSLSQATTDKALSSAYSDAVKKVGQDLAYGMLPSVVYDYGDIPLEVSAVKVMDENGAETPSITISKDMTVYELDTTLSSHVYCIYETEVGQITEKADLTSFDIEVGFDLPGGESAYTAIQRSDNISAAFIAAGAYQTNTVNIKFTLLSDRDISVIWKVTLTGEAENSVNELWPTAFLYNALGVNIPEITGYTVEYLYFIKSGEVSLYVMTFDLEAVIDTYVSLLEYNGFVKDSTVKNLFTQEFTTQNKKVTVSLATHAENAEVDEHCLLIKASSTVI